MTSTAANPFLEGNFAPIREEVVADDLTVIGELPPDLSGMFVRNGPNPQFPPLGNYHWFDGDGMLHGVRVKDGKASYRNRYVRTRGFLKEREAGKAIWTGLMEPPRMDNPEGPFKNAANTALIWHAGQFLALWEGGEPHAIRLPELETAGPHTFNGKLTSAFTAHPKIDPVTGEMLFFGYSLGPDPHLDYSIATPAGELSRTVRIELPVGSMHHDFAVTENYTIFMDLPLKFYPEKMQRGEPAWNFESELPAKFGILPRHGDNNDIRWFDCPSCFIFHTLNAYEEGDEIVLTACRMKSTTVLSMQQTDDRDAEIPRLHQWRFNLKTGEAQEEQIDDRASDFPRINEGRMGRKNRYGYTAKMAPEPVPLFDGLIKYDRDRGTSEVHEFGPERFGGEAVFVPRPEGTAEDDGWLVTFVHNRESNQSEFVVIDARNVADGAIARVIMPHRVPYGFHGTWVSEEELARSLS